MWCCRPSERQQLEVQAALDAVAALIHNLGPFLSPHLPALLHLLLDPRLLHPGTAACQLAGEARGRLCQAVPARLLLPALIQHLHVATQVGHCSLSCCNLELLPSAVPTCRLSFCTR